MAEHWTPKMVEERFEEAALTLRRLPPVKVQGYFNTWPPMLREFWEAFGWSEAELRLGPPTPRAIDRMDITLRWLNWLELEETRLVWLRAQGVRWKAIALRFGVDRSTAWRHWTCALIKIASRLNAEAAANMLQQKTVRQGSRNLTG